MAVGEFGDHIAGDEAPAPRYWNSHMPSRLIRAFFTDVVPGRKPGPFHRVEWKMLSSGEYQRVRREPSLSDST
jgi:hypothetical protein